MAEQAIILMFLILALGAILWLYFLKAKKQIVYKGMVHDTEIVFTLQRVTLFVEFYIGIRNLIELAAIKYFDKQL